MEPDPEKKSNCQETIEDTGNFGELIQSAASFAELYVAVENAMYDCRISTFLFFLSDASKCHNLDAKTMLSNWPASLLNPMVEHDVFANLDIGEVDPKNPHQFAYDIHQPLFTMGFRNRQQDEQIASLARGVGYALSASSAKKKTITALLSYGDRSCSCNGEKLLEVTQLAARKLASLYSETNTSSHSLSKRELECLRWTSEGKTSYEISIILRLSEHTINNYIASLTKKLGAMNRAHMISLAYKTGLLA